MLFGLMVHEAVDGILDNNHLLSVFIIKHLIGNMKILTDKLLPPFPNPLRLQTCRTENGMIVVQLADTGIQAPLLVLHRLIAQCVPMPKYGGIVEVVDGLMDLWLDDYFHASG